MQKGTNTHIVTGLDIGTKTTRVIVCAISPDSAEPKILGMGTAPTRGLHHGYIINRGEAIKCVRTALREAEREAGIPIKNILVAMGGIGIDVDAVTTTIPVEHPTGEVSSKDIDRAVSTCEDILFSRTRNKRVLHATPLKFQLDGEAVLGHPIGMRGKKLSIKTLFVTCLEHHFDELVSVVTDAGVGVVDVIAAPLAASFATLNHRDKMAGSALLDIGAETVSLAVFEDNNLLSLKVFPIGSNDITNDIALGFQIPLDEAEVIKLQVQSGQLSTSKERQQQFAQSKVNEIVQARLSDVFELVDRHLKEIKRSNLLPAGIVITGGGSVLNQLHDFAKSSLKLPVRIIDGISMHTGKKKLRDASWYVVFGLCNMASNDMSAHYRSPSPLKQLFGQTKESLHKLFKQLIP